MGDIIRYTETTTMDGVAFSVSTVNAMSFRPDVTLDDVAVQLLTEGDDAPGQASWYWQPDGHSVYRGDAVPPDAGVVLVIDYEAEISNAVEVSTPFVITDQSANNRTGDYVRVVDVKGLTDASQAQAIASGIARRASVIPEKVTYTHFGSNWQPGQVQSINLPDYDLVGDYLVTQIVSTSKDGTEIDPNGTESQGRGSSFTRQIELLKIQDAAIQDPAATDPGIPATSYDGSWTSYNERIVSQSAVAAPQAQYETAPFALGVGGSLTGGVSSSNQHIVQFSGNAMIAIAHITTPATGQNVKLDILRNGLTIFSSKITVPAGSTSVVTSRAFIGAPRPYRLKQYDKLRAVLTYQTSELTVTGASGVSLFLVISR